MLILSFFFFNDTATTEIYTLSLHDALPISELLRRGVGNQRALPPGLEPDVHRRKHLDGHGHGQQRPRVDLEQHERVGRPGGLHLARRRHTGGDVHRHESQRRNSQRRRCGLRPGDRAIVHRARGFTLAEVLVATAVLTIGLVAIATGFPYATSGVATGGGGNPPHLLPPPPDEGRR